MEVPDGLPVGLAPDEHNEFKWCGFDEAHDLMKWEGSKAALRLLEKKLSG